MRRRHKALIATAAAALALLGVGLVDCAAPTQIVVEVYSDACPGTNHPGPSINGTGIAVGTATDIDKKSPAAFRDNCENPPKGGVGTLTIYPSGANDSTVAIKVVAGVEIQPDLCHAPDYAGCIVHRRVMNFVPNTTQRITVRLSLACLNRVCQPGSTCDDGVCKAETDILPDGGTKADAATSPAGIAEGGVIVDAGNSDACTGCKGQCTQGACIVDCKKDVCDAGEQCSPTLPCTITCDGTGHCNDVQCNTSSTCTVNCGDPKLSCNEVTCNAATCIVNCSGANSCGGDGGIFLEASTSASLTCNGDNACQSASCNSPDCTLHCNPNNGDKNACPPQSTCSGGCNNWNNASQ